MKLQENYGVPSSQVIPFISTTCDQIHILRSFISCYYHERLLPRLSLLRTVLTVFCSIARHRRLGASMGIAFYESMAIVGGL